MTTINHMSTPRELSAYLAQHVTLPVNADAHAHDREMAHRLMLVQSYCMTKHGAWWDDQWDEYCYLSISTAKRLQQLEEDAKRFGFDLYPDSIVNA